jgi:hypothetical protein
MADAMIALFAGAHLAWLYVICDFKFGALFGFPTTPAEKSTAAYPDCMTYSNYDRQLPS